MPSRFAFFSNQDYIENRFNVEVGDLELYDYYNVKPTNRVTGLVNIDGKHELVRLRWGFVKGNKFFKARAETASEKRLYGKAMRERRCLVIANGFFEWDKDDSGSTPYYFTLKNEEAFCIAGLYNSFVDDEDGETKYTVAILTVEANNTVGEVFHRMPAIIAKEHESTWIDPDSDLDKVEKLLQPFDDDKMESWKVNPLPARGDNGPDTIAKASETTSLDDFF